MKKKAYRSVHVNQLSVDLLRKKVGDQPITIGIDVGKVKMVAALVSKTGEVLQTLRWAHPEETLTALELLGNLGVETEVAMEPTGTYGDALLHQLEIRGLPTFLVSPKHTHDMSEVYDGVPSSHDSKCAAVVAMLHALKKSRPWPKSSEEKRNLRSFLDLYNMFQTQQQRGLGLLESGLARHWPELPQIVALTSISILELLIRYGGPSGVASTPMEEIEALLRKVSRGSLSEDAMRAIVSSAKATLGTPMNRAEIRMLQAVAEEALHSLRKAGEAEKEIHVLLDGSVEAKEIVPVVGPMATASLIALIGSTLDYASPKALIKATGLNLKERSSGAREGELRITKRGPSRVRQYVYLAVLRLVQHDKMIRLVYARKLERPGAVKLKVIVALMRKVVAALWHQGRGRAFDSAKLFGLEGAA